ncbi:TNT domain-containing protein [Bacillus sp. FSL W7-1360]
MTRSAMSGSRRSGGAVKDVKSGSSSNGSVNSVKSGSGTKSSGSVNSVKSGSKSAGTANNVTGTKSSGSVNSAKSGSQSSGAVKDVKSGSGSASSGTVKDVKGTGKPTDKAVNGISVADQTKLDSWDFKPLSDDHYLTNKSVFDDPKYYNQKNGGAEWPQNAGAQGAITRSELPPGTVIDRYGGTDGTYFSPVGTPYEQRSLALHSDGAPYHKYKWDFIGVVQYLQS